MWVLSRFQLKVNGNTQNATLLFSFQFSTFGFEEFSSVQFPALDATTNDISVTFATTKPNSLLVYNYGKPAGGGRSDFIALELVGGKPRLSWGGSRTGRTNYHFALILSPALLSTYCIHIFSNPEVRMRKKCSPNLSLPLKRSCNEP